MKYYPILLSKAGELLALKMLSPSIKEEVSPIIQIVGDNFDEVERLLTNEWSFMNNQVLLDFSLVVDAMNKTSFIESLIKNCISAGVNVVLVFDSSSTIQYTHLIIKLRQLFKIDICIRTSNKGGGFTNYNTQITNHLQTLNIHQNSTLLLLDFGYVQSGTYARIVSTASDLIRNLPNNNLYREVIISSGSFPENLTTLNANQLHFLKRYEWEVWGQLKNQNLPVNIKYSDYGTKHPVYTEANFRGTCSIKYTTDLEFAIYRGELSSNHPLGNGQYIHYAQQLVQSNHYSGINFSWGDGKINLIASQNPTPPPAIKPGNAKTWVEISQNHHITLLEGLL